MPSQSQAQKNLMAGVAHGWKPDQVKAPKVGVAKEFNMADQRAKAGALRRRGGLVSPQFPPEGI